MRSKEEASQFHEFLLRVGDGTADRTDDRKIQIPEQFMSKGNLIEETFGTDINQLTVQDLGKRAILCPKNIHCKEINDIILEMMRGDMKVYFSRDEALYDPGDHQVPVEFLNSVTPSGMPDHELRLKVGPIVMLLRNLNVNAGLCNGTRMIVQEMNEYSIKCSVLSTGQVVIVPRIDMTPCNKELPFILKRKQFPLRVCFAITIHKSQGQSFENVGVYLPEPLFCHGHLYVALSRSTSAKGLKVWMPDSEKCTYNIVIPDLLL